MMLRQCSRALVRASSRQSASATQRISKAFIQTHGKASLIYDNIETPFEDINRHRSDAELRIAAVPVVEVDGHVAVCDGGGGALGHPVEYIQLDTVKHFEPQTCKYCGLRYKMKAGSHGHH
ncbi:hypothetical protein Poli38472_004535 [Pythium oligandrum]|uniref:Zinc finger CHCC-type domain-containing protein n=1 Tax=Pythium oligandrum TaxID=41045 RepID=A0A8K1CA36_PYTOL|nr:hypothetical protein Poli38472_004535 [Pythium oligandrum]|eukprot:TMW59466.1 hypothetical protein Poli38472_004535 [Pythium oligandrum]